MAAVVFGLLAFFIFIITRLSEPGYKLLYSDLDLAESSRIVEQLEADGVKYSLKENGSMIFVPSDKVSRIRIKLAQEGLPSTGSVGNELFEESSGFGSSTFMQQLNKVRAMEGELSRTIASIDRVKNARVHLVLPERELFSREKREPSASIVLKMAGAKRLDAQQVAAIQHLVASAVPELAPTQVSIVDDKGTLLAKGFRDANDPGALASDATEKRIAFENRLAGSVEEILERVIGVGRVRAQVSADMNFDRLVKNTESYDPDSQVVRSTQLIEESLNAEDREAEEAVSVQANIPEIIEEPVGGDGAAAGSFSNQSRTEETINYEISRIVQEEVRESGVVERLSIAVLVDGTYTENAEGEKVYEPRSQEELDRLTKLVRSAVGYSEERGDQVEVLSMQFIDRFAETEVVEAKVLGFEEDTFANMVETLIIALVGILAMLLIVRPMMMRLFEAPSKDMANAFGEDGQQLLGGGSSQGQVALSGPAGSGGQMLPPGSAGAGASGGMSGDQQALIQQQQQAEMSAISEQQSELDEMINMQQIEGQIKASSVKRVGEIIEKHPDQAANVLRNWIYEEEQ